MIWFPTNHYRVPNTNKYGYLRLEKWSCKGNKL